MDRHALRAIVKGAVHGDSALVSADQLMAASRRDHPLASQRLRPFWAENRVWLLPADTDYSMIFEVDFQPGAGSQPWALQCRREHEDQIPPYVPVAPAGGSRVRFR
jgi:hypothetical protein